MKKNKHGGKRKGAGRSEVKDKMRQVTTSARQSKINSLGGIEWLKKKLTDYTESL